MLTKPSRAMIRTVRETAGTGMEMLTLGGHSDHVWSVAWNPNGKQLATGSFSAQCRRGDTEHRQRLLPAARF